MSIIYIKENIELLEHYKYEIETLEQNNTFIGRNYRLSFPFIL